MSSEIQPIVRSFTIIEYLASSEGARSLREIASACSLPPIDYPQIAEYPMSFRLCGA